MKKILKCENNILLNKDRFTFRVDSESFKVLESGYVVMITSLVKEIKDREYLTKINNSKDLHAVISYVKKNQNILIDEEEFQLCVNGWFDKDEDELVANVSIVISEIDKAIKIGKLLNQMYIYNLGKDLKIYI